jgi:hypothetical protein
MDFTRDDETDLRVGWILDGPGLPWVFLVKHGHDPWLAHGWAGPRLDGFCP